MEKKKEIRIPWGTGIVGYVAESGESVNLPDAYKVSEGTNKFLYFIYKVSIDMKRSHFVGMVSKSFLSFALKFNENWPTNH